ncbi:glycosyltransferase [Streptomyces mauvecolor]
MTAVCASRRIDIVAAGSRGDTQPYVALGLGLAQRGHTVRMVVPRSYAGLLHGTGLAWDTIDFDAGALLATGEGQRWQATGSNVVDFARRSKRISRPLDLFSQLTAAMRRSADAVVFSPFAFPAYSIAERDGVPAVLASFMPFEPTRHFPPLALTRSLGPIGNLLGHLLLEQAIWLVARQPINDWRTHALGLAPIPFTGPRGLVRRTPMPTVHCYSQAVLPRPADWPDCVDVTGYWLLDPPPDWAPPAALTSFLSDGPPPVYVGFGSMVPGDPAATFRLVRAALRRAGTRGVYLGDPSEHPGDETVHVVRDVPHTWLFPRMAAVVHHGGSSTVGAGLRAGLPTVVCPHFLDQPMWGARIHALGAGPRPLPARKLTAASLGDAIATALHDRRMRETAARLGKQIRAESGVERACQAIETHIAAYPSTPRR